MPAGYVTVDSIDLNEIWYGAVIPALDTYRSWELPIITSLAMPWGEQIMKYGLSAKNGFQRLARGQRPDRKFVEVATMYPVVNKTGYGVGTDLDTLQRSNGKEVTMAFNRPMAEDPEAVLIEFLRVMMTDPSTSNAGYGFYNGAFATEEKITAPPQYGQQTFAAGHTHYIASNTTGVLALADITEMKATIRHHGYRGPIVAFINSTTVQVLEDLAAWTSNSIIRGPISDMVAVDGFGERFGLLGVTFHVTEMIPSSYLLMVEANGAESERPLIMFEPSNMRGLQLHHGNNPNYPLVESYWTRWM